MEGTRHERVALIAAAYVIGFITAFIAFGLEKINETDIHADTQAVIKNASAQQAESSTQATSVGMGEDGLFVITDKGERMLSANMQVLGASIISGAGEPGIYYSIIDAEASHNGAFVYFCEQLTQAALTCDPYVYSLANDTIYPVKIGDEKYKAPIATHKSTWTNDSTLVLNGATSLDQQQPWLLTVAESEVAVQQAFVQ